MAGQVWLDLDVTVFFTMHYLKLLLHGPQQLLETLFNCIFAQINLGPLPSGTAKHFYEKSVVLHILKGPAYGHTTDG